MFAKSHLSYKSYTILISLNATLYFYETINSKYHHIVEIYIKNKLMHRSKINYHIHQGENFGNKILQNSFKIRYIYNEQSVN